MTTQLQQIIIIIIIIIRVLQRAKSLTSSKKTDISWFPFFHSRWNLRVICVPNQHLFPISDPFQHRRYNASAWRQKMCFVHNIQTGSVAHAASCSLCSIGFLEDEAIGAWFWTHLVARLRTSGALPSPPYAFAVCARTFFTFAQYA